MTIELLWWREMLATVTDGKTTWLHVWGPSECGKSAFAAWLDAQTCDCPSRRTLRIDAADLPSDPEAGKGALLRVVLEKAGLAKASLQEMGDGFQQALVGALQEQDQRLLLILDGIDAQLIHRAGLKDFVLSHKGVTGDPQGRLTLVTTGTYPIKSVLRMTRGLAEPGDWVGTDVMANWMDKIEGLESQLQDWDRLSPTDKNILTSKADMHPGLMMRLLEEANKAEAFDQAMRKADDAMAELRTSHVHLSLLPWLEVNPVTTLQAQLQIRGLTHLLPDVMRRQSRTDSPQKGQQEPVVLPPDDDIETSANLAVALGLIHPARIKHNASAPVVELRKDRRVVSYVTSNALLDDLCNKIAARLVDLHRISYVLRQAEDLGEQEQDEALQNIRALVIREFCESPRGQARATELLDRATVLIPGVQYALTLKWRDEDLQARTNAATYGHSYSTLRIFRGMQSAYRDLWRREFSILRELSNTGHPAFPDFRQNATLVDKAGDQETYGYMLIEDEGQPLNEEVRARLRDKRHSAEAFREIKSLITGLVRLQARAMVHQLISPERLRFRYSGNRLRLLFGGFEIATGAHIASAPDLSEMDTEQAYPKTPITAQLMRSLFESAAARRFIEPSSQGLFFDDLPQTSEAVMPQSDVYGLCLTLLDTFYGPPDAADLAVFVAAKDDTAAKVALIALLENYRKVILAEPPTVIAPALRDILLKGIDVNQSDRATAIDLQREILSKEQVLRDFYANDTKSTLLLTYNSDNMLAELGRKHRNLIDIDWGNPKTLRGELHAFLKLKLRGARRIFRDPNGYSRFVTNSDHVNEQQEWAKIVIVCDDMSFYCDYAGKFLGVDLGSQVLTLRYVLARRNHAMVGLVADDDQTLFPNTQFDLYPDDTPELRQGTLKDLTLDREDPVDWRIWLQVLRDAKVDKAQEVAVDAMTFVTQVLRKQRHLIQFPVKVSRSMTDEGGWIIKLDQEAFDIKRSRDDYLTLLWQEVRVSSNVFFQAAILDWMDRNSGGDHAVRFNPDGTDVNIRLPIGPEDVQQSGIRIRQDIFGLKGIGRLTYSDDQGVESLYRRQTQAMERSHALTGVLAQLDRPHPTLALTRSQPDGFGKGLSGKAPKIIWNMVNAHPLFLLQGPPGTGKTRALTEFCHHVLTQDDVTAKFLISAQSHATVDTTLERIADAFLRKDGSTENFHMIRHMPVARPERVSQAVRETYDVDPQVDRLTRRIRDRANIELDQMSAVAADDSTATNSGKALLEIGFEMLRNVGDHALDEVAHRFKRNASLHFVTTSGAAKPADEVLEIDEKFHTSIVEEAATGWGPSLVQPLIESHAAILIGDHRQIGPYDANRLRVLARLACGGGDDQGERKGRGVTAPAIFPQYREDPSILTRWMEPFGRIFTEIEQERMSEVQAGVTIADTLNRQFRSVRQVGDLVSQAFYRGKVKWGGVQFDPQEAVLDLTQLEACRGKDKALVWLDTAKIGDQALHRPNAIGRMENAAEIRVLREVLQFGRRGQALLTASPQAGGADVPITDRLMVLSPYRSQVDAIKAALRQDPATYGFSPRRELALQQIDQVVGTVDAAQGAEATTVIVSMARAVSADNHRMPDPKVANPSDYEAAIRRNYGFLTEPERINVMISRAKQQLVIIGHFDFYASLVEYLNEWGMSHGRGTRVQTKLSEDQGFWELLIKQMEKHEHNVPSNSAGGKLFA